MLPYFRKSEGLAPTSEVMIDDIAHNSDGPLGVSVRSPVLRAAQDFVAAAEATGVPRGDYNGRDRGGASGVASLFQTTTRLGKRSSTYHAFLEGAAEQRPNLTVITGAHATRLILEHENGKIIARGVEYRTEPGDIHAAHAGKEVILSAGAIGSPHLLMLSGIGPRVELEAVGVSCVVESPGVGKHLKDHLHVPMYFPAPGVGVALNEVGVSLGPSVLRGPGGPLPADPAEDSNLPAELQALKSEAERRITEWATTGNGLVSSLLYDAVVFSSTGLGDPHTHDSQIACFVSAGGELLGKYLNIDLSMFFDDPAKRLAPETEAVFLLANPVQPHSEGEVVLASADPSIHPTIRMNYYDDPHDMKVMVAVLRQALEIASHWPGNRKIGPVLIPPFLAKKHGYRADDELDDALLEDFARHFSVTVYHCTSTCRIGDVVDHRLRVMGVGRLRVADASVMPNVISGNTNAPSIMIGEKAAEMIAVDHGVKLAAFVGERAA